MSEAIDSKEQAVFHEIKRANASNDAPRLTAAIKKICGLPRRADRIEAYQTITRFGHWRFEEQQIQALESLQYEAKQHPDPIQGMALLRYCAQHFYRKHVNDGGSAIISQAFKLPNAADSIEAHICILENRNYKRHMYAGGSHDLAINLLYFAPKASTAEERAIGFGYSSVYLRYGTEWIGTPKNARENAFLGFVDNLRELSPARRGAVLRKIGQANNGHGSEVVGSARAALYYEAKRPRTEIAAQGEPLNA